MILDVVTLLPLALAIFRYPAGYIAVSTALAMIGHSALSLRPFSIWVLVLVLALIIARLAHRIFDASSLFSLFLIYLLVIIFHAAGITLLVGLMEGTFKLELFFRGWLFALREFLMIFLIWLFFACLKYSHVFLEKQKV